MEKQDFRNQRKQRREPTRFPAVFTLVNHETSTSTDFYIAAGPGGETDSLNWQTAKLNARNLDPQKVQAILQERGSNHAFTATDIEAVIKDGEPFIAKRELEKDGDPVACGGCGRTFQPVKTPWVNGRTKEEGVSGNFRAIKAADLEEIVKPDVKAKIKQTLADLTKVVTGQDAPGHSYIVAECERCKRNLRDEGASYLYYATRADVPSKMADLEDKLSAKEQQREYTGAMTRHRKDTGSRGASHNSSGNNGGYGRRDTRRVDLGVWQGISLHANTAQALTEKQAAGKFAGWPQVVRDMAIGKAMDELLKEGVVQHEGQAKTVVFRITGALDSQERTEKQAAELSASAVTLGDVVQDNKTNKKLNKTSKDQRRQAA